MSATPPRTIVQSDVAPAIRLLPQGYHPPCELETLPTVQSIAPSAPESAACWSDSSADICATIIATPTPHTKSGFIDPY